MADPSSRRTAVAVAAFAAGLALLAGPAVSQAGASGAAAPALYTSAQAAAGAKVFASQCSTCHGEHLEGGVGPALTGPNLVRLAKKTKLAVGDVFSFLSLQMPLNAPASLTHDQYVSVMAYILKVNGYPAGATALTYAGATKSTVIMTTYGK
ncbi:MAG TPA: c-type cytochrome [Candidatus Elarobacter sp.]|nr:c-type cytochrome [Candidatus Elarobacter sp.]